MKSTIFAASALLSTTYAASVHLATTGCVNPDNNPLEEFDIPIIGGSDAPTVKALNQVCGIKVVSATDVDVNFVQCQAFRDAAGTQIGSALFSYDSPALIATNPVQEGSIRCVIAPSVQLQSTSCISPSNPIQEYSIPLSVASNQVIQQTFQDICGLKIVSASDPLDVNLVQCQVFKDPSGEQPGSAVFTYADPAAISTNPVQEASVRCTIASASSSSASSPSSSYSSSSSRLRRQTSSNSTTPVPSANVTVSPPQPSKTSAGSVPVSTNAAAESLGLSVGLVAAAFAALML